MSDDTVPVSALGIGDDDVKEELESHTEEIVASNGIKDVHINTGLMDGVAHMKVRLFDTRTKLPENVQNYIIANDLHMFDPQQNSGAIEFRLTTGDIYDVWGDMDSPEIRD